MSNPFDVVAAPPSALGATNPFVAAFGESAAVVWYYTINGSDPMPVPADALGNPQLHTLEAEALVWTEGLAEWEPISSFAGAFVLRESCESHT